MKKIFIFSFLFLSFSFFAFGETENNSKSEKLLASSNIITEELTKVQEGAVTETAGSTIRNFVGVGFDFFVGVDKSKQLFASESDSNVFVETTSIQNLQIPFVGTTNFIAGTRLSSLNLDLFGRIGMGYGYIAKETTDFSYASLGILGLSVDVNARGNISLTNTLDLFGTLGAGMNFNLRKFIDVTTGSSPSPTRFSQEVQRTETQLFGNVTLGLSFRIGKTEGLNIGYGFRYYFSSMYNTNDYILLDNAGNNSVIQYGNNQFMHGINFEYLFFL